MATKNTKKMRGDKIQIGVWISKDTYAKATEIAKTKEFTFSDILRIALKEYNRPHSSLRNREGKRVWLTPLQKRAELMEDYKKNGFKDENDKEIKIRFLKRAA
mgnify:CR=1 FL=1